MYEPFQRAVIVFKDAAGIWYEDRYRPYVCMTVNVTLNLILVQFCGVYGVIISSIAAFAISIPWISRTLFRTLFQMSCAKFLVRIVFYAVVTIIAAIITLFLCELLPLGDTKVQSMIWLVVRGMICLIVPNLIFVLFYFRLEEFKQVTKLLLGKLKKIKR